MKKLYTQINFVDTNDKYLPHIINVYHNDGYNAIWEDIKQAIKEVSSDKFHEGIVLEYITLFDRIIKFDDYEFNNYELNNNENNDDKFEYKIILYYSNSAINFYVFKNINELLLHECYYLNAYLKYTKGNCVDDFIKRGVESRVNIINNLVDNIKSRVNIRDNSIEYHQTSCYELDFTQISLIQKNAEKIVENCKKELENISEKYTKLY